MTNPHRQPARNLTTATPEEPEPLMSAELVTAKLLQTALMHPGGLPDAQQLSALRQRVQALHDPTAPDTLDELRRQLPLLEALWQRFAHDSLKAGKAEQKSSLLRAALQAQQAYARTFALLQTLTPRHVPVVDDIADQP